MKRTIKFGGKTLKGTQKPRRFRKLNYRKARGCGKISTKCELLRLAGKRLKDTQKHRKPGRFGKKKYSKARGKK